MPAPCRPNPVRLEGLKTSDICTEGKVAVAHLQGVESRAGSPADVEGLDYAVALGARYRPSQRGEEEEEERLFMMGARGEERVSSSLDPEQMGRLIYIILYTTTPSISCTATRETRVALSAAQPRSNG